MKLLMNVVQSMLYSFVMSLGVFMWWNYDVVVVAMFGCE